MADTIEASTQTDPVVITSVRKRHNESNEDNGVIKKSFKNVVLKMLIPNATVGAVLGKKGEEIVSAQKSTGAAAKLSKLGEFYPGTSERICLMSGELESVIDFCSFIIEKIISATKEWPDLPNISKQPQIKLLVSNAAAGVIIGKHGAYVQEIKEQCGVFIQLSQKAEGNSISERCVIVAGSKDQINSAIAKIVGAIAQDSSFNSLSVLNYFGNNDTQKPPSQQQPSYPPQPPWPNVMPTDRYHDRFSIVSMSESPSVSFPVDPSATFTNKFNQKIRSISSKMDQVEQTIEVPEPIIGYILGKGGAALMELKSMTMTDIKISKKGEYVPNTNNRLVTVSGVAGNVEYALRVIKDSVQGEKRRRLFNEHEK